LNDCHYGSFNQFFLQGAGEATGAFGSTAFVTFLSFGSIGTASALGSTVMPAQLE